VVPAHNEGCKGLGELPWEVAKVEAKREKRLSPFPTGRLNVDDFSGKGGKGDPFEVDPGKKKDLVFAIKALGLPSFVFCQNKNFDSLATYVHEARELLVASSCRDPDGGNLRRKGNAKGIPALAMIGLVRKKKTHGKSRSGRFPSAYPGAKPRLDPRGLAEQDERALGDQVPVALLRLEGVDQKVVPATVGLENHGGIDEMDMGFEKDKKRRLFPDHRPEKRLGEKKGVLAKTIRKEKRRDAPRRLHQCSLLQFSERSGPKKLDSFAMRGFSPVCAHRGKSWHAFVFSERTVRPYLIATA